MVYCPNCRCLVEVSTHEHKDIQDNVVRGKYILTVCTKCFITIKSEFIKKQVKEGELCPS